MAATDLATAVSNSEDRTGVHWSAWYALGLLTAINMLNYVDRTVLSVVLQPIRAEFHLSDGQLGALSGLAYSVPSALVGIPLGVLIDRTNRRNLLSGLIVLWSGLTMLSSMAQGFATLLWARMTVGAAEAGAAPAALSMIGDIFAEQRRPGAVGIFYMATALGAAVSFILGGLIAAHFGWRAAFLCAGLPGFLAAGMLFFTVREPVREIRTVASAPPTLRQTAACMMNNRLFLHLLIALVLSAMVASAFTVWIVSFLIRVHGLQLSTAGVLVGIGAGLFGGFGAFTGGFIGQKLGRHRRGRVALTAALSSLAMAGTAALMIGATNTTVAIAAMLAFKLCLHAYVGPGYGMAISLLKPRMRGVSMSVVQILCNVIGYGLGPLLVGLISGWYGGPNSLRAGLSIIVLLSLWAAAHFYLASRAPKTIGET